MCDIHTILQHSFLRSKIFGYVHHIHKQIIVNWFNISHQNRYILKYKDVTVRWCLAYGNLALFKDILSHLLGDQQQIQDKIFIQISINQKLPTINDPEILQYTLDYVTRRNGDDDCYRWLPVNNKKDNDGYFYDTIHLSSLLQSRKYDLVKVILTHPKVKISSVQVKSLFSIIKSRNINKEIVLLLFNYFKEKDLDSLIKATLREKLAFCEMSIKSGVLEPVQFIEKIIDKNRFQEIICVSNDIQVVKYFAQDCGLTPSVYIYETIVNYDNQDLFQFIYDNYGDLGSERLLKEFLNRAYGYRAINVSLLATKLVPGFKVSIDLLYESIYTGNINIAIELIDSDKVDYESASDRDINSYGFNTIHIIGLKCVNNIKSILDHYLYNNNNNNNNNNNIFQRIPEALYKSLLIKSKAKMDNFLEWIWTTTILHGWQDYEDILLSNLDIYAEYYRVNSIMVSVTKNRVDLIEKMDPFVKSNPYIELPTKQVNLILRDGKCTEACVVAINLGMIDLNNLYDMTVSLYSDYSFYQELLRRYYPHTITPEFRQQFAEEERHFNKTVTDTKMREIMATTPELITDEFIKAKYTAMIGVLPLQSLETVLLDFGVKLSIETIQTIILELCNDENIEKYQNRLLVELVKKLPEGTPDNLGILKYISKVKNVEFYKELERVYYLKPDAKGVIREFNFETIGMQAILSNNWQVLEYIQMKYPQKLEFIVQQQNVSHVNVTDHSAYIISWLMKLDPDLII